MQEEHGCAASEGSTVRVGSPCSAAGRGPGREHPVFADATDVLRGLLSDFERHERLDGRATFGRGDLDDILAGSQRAKR